MSFIESRRSRRLVVEGKKSEQRRHIRLRFNPDYGRAKGTTMNLFCTHRTVTEKRTNYATNADFSTLFSEEMTSLHQLCYLLTADHNAAEQCFTSALDDCVQQHFVFRERALPFSRRAIVQNAVRMIYPRPFLYRPSPASAKLATADDLRAMPVQNATLARVLALTDFERFVFVLSILERFPVRECAAMLGCAPHEIHLDRMRTLEQMTGSSTSAKIRRHTRVLVARDSSLRETRGFDGDLLDCCNRP